MIKKHWNIHNTAQFDAMMSVDEQSIDNNLMITFDDHNEKSKFIADYFFLVSVCQMFKNIGKICNGMIRKI